MSDAILSVRFAAKTNVAADRLKEIYVVQRSVSLFLLRNAGLRLHLLAGSKAGQVG